MGTRRRRPRYYRVEKSCGFVRYYSQRFSHDSQRQTKKTQIERLLGKTLVDCFVVCGIGVSDRHNYHRYMVDRGSGRRRQSGQVRLYSGNSRVPYCYVGIQLRLGTAVDALRGSLCIDMDVVFVVASCDNRIVGLRLDVLSHRSGVTGIGDLVVCIGIFHTQRQE